MFAHHPENEDGEHIHQPQIKTEAHHLIAFTDAAHGINGKEGRCRCYQQIGCLILHQQSHEKAAEGGGHKGQPLVGEGGKDESHGGKRQQIAENAVESSCCRGYRDHNDLAEQKKYYRHQTDEENPFPVKGVEGEEFFTVEEQQKVKEQGEKEHPEKIADAFSLREHPGFLQGFQLLCGDFGAFIHNLLTRAYRHLHRLDFLHPLCRYGVGFLFVQNVVGFDVQNTYNGLGGFFLVALVALGVDPVV